MQVVAKKPSYQPGARAAISLKGRGGKQSSGQVQITSCQAQLTGFSCRVSGQTSGLHALAASVQPPSKAGPCGTLWLHCTCGRFPHATSLAGDVPCLGCIWAVATNAASTLATAGQSLSLKIGDTGSCSAASDSGSIRLCLPVTQTSFMQAAHSAAAPQGQAAVSKVDASKVWALAASTQDDDLLDDDELLTEEDQRPPTVPGTLQSETRDQRILAAVLGCARCTSSLVDFGRWLLKEQDQRLPELPELPGA